MAIVGLVLVLSASLLGPALVAGQATPGTGTGANGTNGTTNGTNASAANGTADSSTDSARPGSGGRGPSFGANTTAGDLGLNGSGSNATNVSDALNGTGTGANGTNATNTTNLTGPGAPGGGVGFDPVAAAVSAVEEIIRVVVEQLIAGIRLFSGPIVRFLTMTPAPNNAGNYFQNPTNLQFPAAFEQWQSVGVWLARVAWIGLIGLLLGLGSFGLGVVPRTQEKKSWIYGVVLGSIMITPAGWTITNVFPAVLDVIARALTLDATNGTVWGAGVGAIILIIVLIAALFHVWALIALLVVAAFRIELIMFLVPLVPALFILRWWPFGLVSAPAHATLLVWVVLLFAGLPSALLLGITFSGAEIVAEGAAPADAALLTMGASIGATVGALLMPFLLLKASGMLLGFQLSGVGETGEALKNKQQQYRDRGQELRDQGSTAVREGREAKRGLRNEQPVEGDRWNGDTSRGYDAGAKARNFSSGLKDRAADMKSRISK